MGPAQHRRGCDDPAGHIAYPGKRHLLPTQVHPGKRHHGAAGVLQTAMQALKEPYQWFCGVLLHEAYGDLRGPRRLWTMPQAIRYQNQAAVDLLYRRPGIPTHHFTGFG